jgi:hypothetical protein
MSVRFLGTGRHVIPIAREEVAKRDQLTPRAGRLFQAEVASVLRRTIPDPEWPDPVVDIRRRHARETTPV